MVEPAEKKSEYERLQAEALRRRIRLFVRHHPAFAVAVGSYVIGGVIVALYSYFWLGRLPPAESINSLSLVLVVIVLGAFSLFVLYILMIPLFPVLFMYDKDRFKSV